MKKIIYPLLYIIIGVVIWYIFPHTPVDYNSELLYGNSWLPKNCRAIITTNVAAYKNREYSADDIIESIDRNCGKNGYSWNID